MRVTRAKCLLPRPRRRSDYFAMTLAELKAEEAALIHDVLELTGRGVPRGGEEADPFPLLPDGDGGAAVGKVDVKPHEVVRRG